MLELELLAFVVYVILFMDLVWYVRSHKERCRSDSPIDKMTCDVLFKISCVCSVFLVIIYSGQYALWNFFSELEILEALVFLVVFAIFFNG